MRSRSTEREGRGARRPPVGLLAPLFLCACQLVYPVDPPPESGRIQVRLTVTRAGGYPQLTLEWRGRWLQETEGSTGGEAPTTAEAVLDAGAVFDGQEVAFDESEGLRTGLWEFVISGSASAGGSDLFVPAVCRQEVFGDRTIELAVVEGRVGCVSDMGGEPEPVDLWGSPGATGRAFSLTQGETRAFPAMAQQGGEARRVFVLLRQGTVPQTRPGLAPLVLGAFYQDQAGQPGAILGGAFNLELIPVLEFRGRLSKVVPEDDTTWTLTGDTWVWGDLGAPLALEPGQTYHLGLLDPCPGAGTCSQQPFVLIYTGQAARSFRGSGTNLTALPDPFAGTTTNTNAAPLAALAVTR